MNFLDPFQNGNGNQQAPPPAARSSGMNYGGAQQRQQNQQPQQQQQQQQQQRQQQTGYRQQQPSSSASQPSKNSIGIGALSMLDPLAQQGGGLAVRERSNSAARRSKPIGRPHSMDMSHQVKQHNTTMQKQPSFNEFDPLSGGGNKSNTTNNNASSFNTSNPFSNFGNTTTSNQSTTQPMQPQRTMNVSQAFGGVGQPQQQRQQQQQMAGLGQQVFQMGISTPQQQRSGSNGFDGGFDGDDDFFGNSNPGNGGGDPFGSDDFSSNGFDDFGDSSNNKSSSNSNNGNNDGFDMDDLMAKADLAEQEKEKKKRKKLEKSRKKKANERKAQEEADRKLAMQLHAEENQRRGGSSGSNGEASDQQQNDQSLPGGWTRDHRGNLQGRVFERVTTKLIGHKWSPRSMMITGEQIVLRKIEAEKRGQQRSFPITEYTTVGAAYINPEQAHATIDVDGTGPKRVYQFKLIEKEPWGNEPKQLCKLGSTDLRVIKFLRNIIAERVADKF